MSRIIGCQQLHLAEVVKDDITGTTFGKPQEIPAVMSVEIKDNSESVTFYSNDVIEQVIPAFSGKEVTLELGYLTNELEALITGNTYEKGVFIQNATTVAKEYALLFRAPKSRGGFQYVCLYKGVLSKNEQKYKSKEDKMEGQTVQITGVFSPLVSNGEVAIKADTDDKTPSELIKTWFTEVPMVTASKPAVTPTNTQSK